MNKDLKKQILDAAEILRSHGAEDVFFFGSAARAGTNEHKPIDLAVAGLSPDLFYKSMGAVQFGVRRRCNLVDLDEGTPYVSHIKSRGVNPPPDLFTLIRNELSQVHRLLDRFTPLIDKCIAAVPDDVEVLALAGLLQMYYHGLDKVFTLVATEYDGGLERGATSEADVLDRMTRSTPGRPPVLSEVLIEQLQPYMSFRHAFCNAPSYDLDWKKMAPLVRDAGEVLMLVEVEIERFMSGGDLDPS
jgi:hypothetical protein